MKLDNIVDQPKHYSDVGFPVECIVFTSLLPTHMANAFKYIFRSKFKGTEEQDIQKAIKYMKMFLESVRDDGYAMSYSFTNNHNKKDLMKLFESEDAFNLFGVKRAYLLRKIFYMFGCANPTYSVDVEEGVNRMLEVLGDLLVKIRLDNQVYNPIP